MSGISSSPCICEVSVLSVAANTFFQTYKLSTLVPARSILKLLHPEILGRVKYKHSAEYVDMLEDRVG